MLPVPARTRHYTPRPPISHPLRSRNYAYYSYFVPRVAMLRAAGKKGRENLRLPMLTRQRHWYSPLREGPQLFLATGGVGRRRSPLQQPNGEGHSFSHIRRNDLLGAMMGRLEKNWHTQKLHVGNCCSVSRKKPQTTRDRLHNATPVL